MRRALVAARVDQVVFGAADPKAGAAARCTTCADPRLNHEVEVVRGLRATAAALITGFFEERRG